MFSSYLLLRILTILWRITVTDKICLHIDSHKVRCTGFIGRIELFFRKISLLALYATFNSGAKTLEYYRQFSQITQFKRQIKQSETIFSPLAAGFSTRTHRQRKLPPMLRVLFIMKYLASVS